MNLSAKILLLNIFRVVSLMAIVLCIAIAALLIPAMSEGGTMKQFFVILLIAAAAAFFVRLYCVGQMNRLKKENPDGVRRAVEDAARVYKYVWLGSFAGAGVGFLLRPAAAVVGQLPLMAVLTRGTNLQGLDRLLIPVAETSFNYVMAGAVIGTVAGFAFSKFQLRDDARTKQSEN